MQVELPPALEAFVVEKVQSGRYRDAGEVLREALRLLELRERAWEPQIDYLEEKLLAGLDSPRKSIDDNFFEEVRRRGIVRLQKSGQ